MSCCAGPNTSSGPVTPQQLQDAVRTHYAEIAGRDSSADSCGNSCFGPSTDPDYAGQLGYSKDDLSSVPEGSNLGLGCGNPVIFAQLHPGETVLDLGSGAGFDALIAARKVGPEGKVIGVDMTPEMISKARRNAGKNGSTNVEFRLGEIEHLPIGDSRVDIVISNCVINLVPESRKGQVFAESFRVLRPGGRLCISDVVTSIVLPEVLRADLVNYAGCLSGATLIPSLDKYLAEAGFVDIRITPKDQSREFIKTWAPGHSITDCVVSALIQATKPE